MALAAAAIVLGAGVIALGVGSGSGASAQRLRAEPSSPPDLVPPATTTPSPAPSRPKPSPHPKASASPAAGQQISMREASPSAPVSPSIRAVLRTLAPSEPVDPFARFGTLTVVSPDSDSTVGVDDPDSRMANVTLSVAEPTGFDSTLLDSTLSWSGTYNVKGVTQYVDLGDGQSLNVDLQAAPRCTTPWTITATLTPPSGAVQQATTRVSIVTC